MHAKESAVPLAYFITFTCYGTWLHGEKTTSVDRQHNILNTPFLSLNRAQATNVKQRMAESPYVLDDTRRHIVLCTVKEVCKYHNWVLLAVHVRTNHIHLVIHAPVSPEYIMNSIKSYASRHLNAAKLDGQRTRRWTHHGSTRYLWKEEEIEATIKYVIHEQGNPMSVWENIGRSFDLTILIR